MTEFERLVKSPDVLGEFLRSLPCLEGPWDTEFHKRFCDKCSAENCDTCPNERYRNNPVWWLTLEVGEDQAAAKVPQEIKIIKPWAENGWITGEIGQHIFHAKVFSTPSKYGINSGRVSKLQITKGPAKMVANYDRGWDTRPEGDETKRVFETVLAFLEALPIPADNHGNVKKRT